MFYSGAGIEFVLYMLISGLFGLMLGSFSNVLIYRLPRKESIVFPRSYCPFCGAPIKYRDNIPVLGFILLRGRCRACSAHISWRYPLIELLTGCMVMCLFAILGFSMQFIADVILGSILIAAAVIDLEHMIIPNRLTYRGVVLALIFSFGHGWFGFLRGVYGALAGILILSFMYWLGKLLFRRDSLGMGDFKLAVVIGFFVGPFWSVIVLALAVLSGGIWGIIQLASGKTKPGREIPFGPFIAAGGFCVLFFKAQILFLIEQYLNML